MPRRSDIKEHSETMSLLGEKYALMKIAKKINVEIDKIDRKLQNIEKRKMFSVLKGDKEV
tara:strand:+ start:578 stop:757 length:180 start_codon:yes stop_codon:yes gene_type:complete